MTQRRSQDGATLLERRRTVPADFRATEMINFRSQSYTIRVVIGDGDRYNGSPLVVRPALRRDLAAAPLT